MRQIRIEAKDQTPKVILDKENSIMEIRGYSFPDEAHEFYDELTEWFKEYIKQPNENTKLIFDLVYINSTSVKFLNDILKKLDTLVDEGKNVRIEWYHLSDDEDMQQLGAVLKEFHKSEFTIIPKKISKERGKQKLF